MRYRKLDDQRDMTFGAQQSDFYRDVPEAPAQAVQTRLGLLSGEWFLDFAEGTPYQGGVLGKYTMDSAEPVIRDRILNSQGVASIVDYDQQFNGDTRTLTISASITTLYGDAEVTGTL